MVKALKYLTVYTIATVKYLTGHYHYHESVYEFSNVSDAGIFEIKKVEDYKSFFDADNFFPKQEDMQSVGEALSYLELVCSEPDPQRLWMTDPEDNGRKTDDKKDEKKSIIKLIMQQKENIISTYRIDFVKLKGLKELQANPDLMNQLEHYYYVLLVNIASISIAMSSDINSLFIEYCIGKSIDGAINLAAKPKTQTILLLKLYITELGVVIKRNPEKKL